MNIIMIKRFLKRNSSGKYLWSLPVEENIEKLNNIALFYPTHEKSEIQNLQGADIGREGESLPTAKAFITALRQMSDMDIKLLNEVQYASIIKQELESIKFPIAPDVMRSVNMNDRKDPSPERFMTKGTETMVDPGLFKPLAFINKIDNRITLGLHKVDKKNKKVIIYGLGHAIGPIHLVLQVE